MIPVGFTEAELLLMATSCYLKAYDLRQESAYSVRAAQLQHVGDKCVIATGRQPLDEL